MNRAAYPLTKTQMGIYLESLTGRNKETYTLPYMTRAAEGVTAVDVMEEVMESQAGRYILVVEGAIPTAYEGRTCIIAEKDGHHLTMTEAVSRGARRAALVLAVGTCAAFGGIPAARGGQTRSMGVQAFLKQQEIAVPVVNVSGCPPHPQWVTDSLVLLIETVD